MDIYQGAATVRAIIEAPRGVIEILELEAPGARVPAFVIVIHIGRTLAQGEPPQGTQPATLGQAGNMAGAVQCAALEVARELAQAERDASARHSTGDQGAGTMDPAQAALLRELLARQGNTKH